MVSSKWGFGASIRFFDPPPKWPVIDLKRPKKLPKRVKNTPKKTRKWVQNDARTIPKWSQNDAGSTQKWSKIIPKWPYFGPFLVPKMVPKRPYIASTLYSNFACIILLNFAFHFSKHHQKIRKMSVKMAPKPAKKGPTRSKSISQTGLRSSKKGLGHISGHGSSAI